VTCARCGTVLRPGVHDLPGRLEVNPLGTMKGISMLLDDIRKTIEATVDNLTPAKAQKLAKSFMDPGTAKEQVAKSAADLLEWSQHSRERMREIIGREIQAQLHTVGVASQADVDGLKKRVRELERAAGMTASGRKKSTGSNRTTARKTAARTPSPKKPTSRKKTAVRASSSTAGAA
jgi:polyhydroxyalkanoate synthesis regulator phasin